ncbi:MAG: hypothetical protein IJV35_06685 [Neisseriaceae bacterium]|nr:hypothetical protein [Neisseriaceae bacterium]
MWDLGFNFTAFALLRFRLPEKIQKRRKVGLLTHQQRRKALLLKGFRLPETLLYPFRQPFL